MSAGTGGAMVRDRGAAAGAVAMELADREVAVGACATGGATALEAGVAVSAKLGGWAVGVAAAMLLRVGAIVGAATGEFGDLRLRTQNSRTVPPSTAMTAGISQPGVASLRTVGWATVSRVFR